jgi:uncharacterized protein YidB (DUF937 family)
VDGLSSVQLNVASLGASQLTSTQSWRAHSHPAMDAAATALGMSASDLRTAMQSGQSLASIASSKGISQDALTAAMATAIQATNPNVSADQATKVATAIATRIPPAGGPAGGPPAGGPPPADATDSTQGTSAASATSGHHHHHHHAAAAAMDAAAQTLGMSTSDLMSSLQSGQTLADIAKSKGVSQADLTKAMSTALQGVDSNLSADQATAMATQMITGTDGSQNQTWAAGTGPASASTYTVTA